MIKYVSSLTLMLNQLTRLCIQNYKSHHKHTLLWLVHGATLVKWATPVSTCGLSAVSLTTSPITPSSGTPSRLGARRPGTNTKHTVHDMQCDTEYMNSDSG